MTGTRFGGGVGRRVRGTGRSVRWGIWSSMVAAACAPDAPPPPTVTVTDSAGVVIVEHPQEALDVAAEWRLAAVPSLEIRTRETGDGAVLRDVGQIGVSDAGELVVMNGDPQEILVFDHAGELRRRVGSAGRGPGEFTGLTSFVLWGDSVVAHDRELRRVTVFGPDGSREREFRFRDLELGYDRVEILPLSGRELVVFRWAGFSRGQERGRFRREVPAYRTDAEGRLLAELGPFPGTELFVSERGMGRVVFGADTHATTVGGLLVVGTAERAEVRFYRVEEPGLVRIVRWPSHDRRVTEERVAAFFESGLSATPESERARAQEVVEHLPVAEREPAYEGLLGSQDGALWVGSYRGPEMALPDARSPRRRWWVFAGDGILVARVDTPEGFDPEWVTPEAVVGVYQDDLGVESVRSYRLER